MTTEKNKWPHRIKVISPVVIVLCALFLGIEAHWHHRNDLQFLFYTLDLFFLVYFSFEIILRFYFAEYRFLFFVVALKKSLPRLAKSNEHAFSDDTQIPDYSAESEKNHDIVEEWSWLFFDLIIVLLGLVSLFSHFLDHPEAVAILRLFRIFRVLRIFEVSSTLKSIERKIISVIPTVFVFAMLLFMIIFVYAIIGMYIFNFRTFASIDFNSLYNAITGLFILSTNGWSGALSDLRLHCPEVSPFFIDFYIISYIVFSVMVTLNVFIAVMTGHIQDKLQYGMKKIEKKEDILLGKVDKNLEAMMEKFNQMTLEIETLKSELRSRSKDQTGN